MAGAELAMTLERPKVTFVARMKRSEIRGRSWVNFSRRVGEDLAALTPHRSGRADFPHPVLRERVSLTLCIGG
jgi:hypothetical protein